MDAITDHTSMGVADAAYSRLRADILGGELLPGNSVPVMLRFQKTDPVTGYSLTFLSGQGDARLFNGDGSKP